MNSSAESGEPTTVKVPDKPLYPIQRPWHVGLLVGITGGLYLWFYCVIYARDLKRLGANVKPWLWFFAPLGPPLLFAIPNLADKYQAVGHRYGADMRHRGWVWGTITFFSLVTVNAFDRYLAAYVSLVSVVLLPAAGAAVGALTSEINRVKSALPEAHYDRPPNQMTPGGWVWLSFGGLVLVPFLVWDIWQESAFLAGGSMSGQGIWEHPDGLFVVEGANGWNVAKSGSFSDGSAEAEFARSGSVWVVVFDHQGRKADDLTAWRRAEYIDDDPDAECQEYRWLKQNSMILRSELLCQSRILGQIDLQLTTVLEDGDRTLEILGSAVGNKLSFETNILHLRGFADGVRLGGDDLDAKVAVQEK